MGLIRYSCGHISGPHEPIPTQFGLWMFVIMLHRYMVSKTLKSKKKKNLWRHRFCTLCCSYSCLLYGTPVTVAAAYPKQYTNLQQPQWYCVIWDLCCQLEESGCVALSSRSGGQCGTHDIWVPFTPWLHQVSQPCIYVQYAEEIIEQCKFINLMPNCNKWVGFVKVALLPERKI